MPEANCCGVQVVIQEGPIAIDFQSESTLQTSFLESPINTGFISENLNVGFDETAIYVDIQSTSTFSAYINKKGADLTGNDGEVNRTINRSGVTMIVVDNQFLHPEVNYTYADDGTITFLNRVWNTQNITLWLS
jgi:hypothetical protein